MMENIYRNDSDPVESNIRRTVREWEEAPPAEWDTPPAALWGKIAASTPPPPATGIIWWKWLSGVLLVLGVVAGSLWWLKSPSTPEKHTPTAAQTPVMAGQTEQPANDLQPESNQQSLTDIPPANTALSNHSTQGAIAARPSTLKTRGSAVWNAKPGTKEAALKNDDFARSDLNVNSGNPTQNESVIAGPSLPASEHSEPAMLQETHIAAETPVAAEIPTAEAPALVLWTPTEPIEPIAAECLDMPDWSVSLPESSIRRTPKTGRFFAGIHLAPNQTFREIQSILPNSQLPPFLRENESASWTTEHGIRAGWQPNRRFALSIGAGSYNMSLITRHRFRIPFDPGRERPTGNNNFESNYNLSIPSSYGDANVEVGVQRPGNQPIMPGQHLMMDTRTLTELRYISMPLTATYFAHNSPRFSVGVKGGAAISLLEKQNFSATTSINIRGLRTRNITVQRQSPVIKKAMADYHLGAALWYRPALGWTVYLEPSYRHSIGPVLEREVYSVGQFAWGVQMGVQKSF